MDHLAHVCLWPLEVYACPEDKTQISSEVKKS